MRDEVGATRFELKELLQQCARPPAPSLATPCVNSRPSCRHVPHEKSLQPCATMFRADSENSQLMPSARRDSPFRLGCCLVWARRGPVAVVMSGAANASKPRGGRETTSR